MSSDAATQPGSSFCPHCGVRVQADARYCPGCGAATQAASSYSSEVAADTRAGWALITSFIGPLLALIIASFASELGQSELATSLILTAGIVAAGIVSLRVLGKDGWRESIGAESAPLDHPSSLLLGIPVGLLVLGSSWLYVYWIDGIFPSELFTEEAIPPLLIAVFTVALLPSLCEEFLCRGAQWAVLRRVVSERETLVATSLLFALIHGLNGGFVLELPHRFVAGLAFGWLRLKTGNLGASIVAHFTNNFVAILLTQ